MENGKLVGLNFRLKFRIKIKFDKIRGTHFKFLINIKLNILNFIHRKLV